jgi:hypothetical protein
MFGILANVRTFWPMKVAANRVTRVNFPAGVSGFSVHHLLQEVFETFSGFCLRQGDLYSGVAKRNAWNFAFLYPMCLRAVDKQMGNFLAKSAVKQRRDECELCFNPSFQYSDVYKVYLFAFSHWLSRSTVDVLVKVRW